MLTRKETRKKARESIRGHYWIFMLACILAAILGTDFGNSLDIFRVTRTEKGEAFLNVGRNSIFVPSTQGESSLWGYIVSGDWQGAKEAVDERFDLLTGEDSYVGVVELGHSRGILASVVNIFSSGALMMAILSVVDLILGSRTAAVVIFSVVSLAIVFFIWLFLINTYQVILKRVFLEGRIYKQVPVARLSYLYRIRRWWQVSAGMLVYKALSFLWMLTVVIYPIKRYAYLLVPYILAENPDVAPMEAIRLSARMMEGHKKEAFLLELTLLPWDILSFISGGVTGIFFSNAYSEAVFAEYYAQVRGEAVKNQVDGVEKLIDRYLFELPDHELMQEAYKDVITLREAPPKPLPSCHPGRLIAENIFGLVPRLDERERCFRAGLKQQIQLEEYEGILAGETYPTRLYILKEREGKRKRKENVGYLRHYSAPVFILMFFIFCFIGWSWEGIVGFLQHGTMINRGVLHGPWLPIYGAGGLMVISLLSRFRKYPLVEFGAIVLLCGTVEYFTSLILELVHGQRWWDYSGYYLNLNGRICAEGLLVFGIGGMATVYILAPMIDDDLEKLKLKIIWPLSIVLLAVFTMDVVFSHVSPNTGEGITDDGKVITRTAAWEYPDPLRDREKDVFA
ncbi:MAG: DUF975 family protein [Blautia sp.]|nr:DUF975 family protein [Blautia sp.]